MASWIGPIMNKRRVQVLLRKAVIALFQSTQG